MISGIIGWGNVNYNPIQRLINQLLTMILRKIICISLCRIKIDSLRFKQLKKIVKLKI
jgi:hypothetical protein